MIQDNLFLGKAKDAISSLPERLSNISPEQASGFSEWYKQFEQKLDWYKGLKGGHKVIGYLVEKSEEVEHADDLRKFMWITDSLTRGDLFVDFERVWHLDEGIEEIVDAFVKKARGSEDSWGQGVVSLRMGLFGYGTFRNIIGSYHGKQGCKGITKAILSVVDRPRGNDDELIMEVSHAFDYDEVRDVITNPSLSDEDVNSAINIFKEIGYTICYYSNSSDYNYGITKGNIADSVKRAATFLASYDKPGEIKGLVEKNEDFLPFLFINNLSGSLDLFLSRSDKKIDDNPSGLENLDVSYAKPVKYDADN